MENYPTPRPLDELTPLAPSSSLPRLIPPTISSTAATTTGVQQHCYVSMGYQHLWLSQEDLHNKTNQT